jgi:hypothetical protein
VEPRTGDAGERNAKLADGPAGEDSPAPDAPPMRVRSTSPARAGTRSSTRPDSAPDLWSPRSLDAPEPESESGSESGSEPDPEPPARAADAPRRRVGLVGYLAVCLVGVLAAVCTLSPVRTVLRQSFTEMGKPTTQFYLDGSPWVSGEYLEVPLGVTEQDGPSAGGFKVRLWTVDGAGATVSSTTVTLAYRDGQGAENLRVTVPPSAQLVWAQIEGTSLSVHYRFEGTALITPTPSAKR